MMWLSQKIPTEYENSTDTLSFGAYTTGNRQSAQGQDEAMFTAIPHHYVQLFIH